MVDKTPHVSDYEGTSAYFRELHATRFRLLALLPVALGAAIATLPPKISPGDKAVLGLVGLAVTIGFTIYDQRNTQIYDRLILRGKLLEKELALPPLHIPTEPSNRYYGGAFKDRPPRRGQCKLRLPILDQPLEFALIWHDLGLAFVYSGTFAGWAFMFFDGLTMLYDLPLWFRHLILVYATVGTGYSALVALLALAIKNDIETERIAKFNDL